MKILNLLYIVLFGFFSTFSYSQNEREANADKKYDQFNYVDAIKTYERIAAKGYKSVDLFQKLGNSYYFNGELAKANKYYTELFALKEEVAPEYYYRYSQCLKSVGNYKKADEMLTKFNQKSGNDERGKLFDKNKDYLAEIKKNSGKYTVESLNINSPYLDYGSAFYGDKLVFASARETDNFLVRKSDWNDQSFMNLFQSTIKADGTLDKPEKLSRNITTKFHESSPIFTRDGNTMYFTRNNYNNGKKGKDDNKAVLLKLYKSVKNGNDWSDATELSFNSNQYSTAHCSLSQDERTLYFVSDMPGTIGQSDIWKSEINSDGSFGMPINLGKTINTEGRETFPYLSDENKLYFATDGHQGLGGLDIFVSKLDYNNNLSEPKNIGEPINSKNDDFAFLLDAKNNSGYFTSNREGGKGFDDIYKFGVIPIPPCVQELIGIVTDKDTGEILANTEVILLDIKFQEVARIMSDQNGKYNFKVICGETYYVRAIKPDYETNEQKIVIPTESGITDLPIKLEKKLKPIKPGDDLAKTFNIKLIYFDLDKSNIRKDAAIELEKILDVMKQNPSMAIDVRSHTDSRATFEYNEKLSDRRVKSSIAWLIKNGIKPERLTGRGYGEAMLVNQCSDGVQCSEEDHQLNRRSEFIIVSK
jgi:outer membrane protein OmpA-like peptidoglycan-associated protein